jgi:phosphoserine phosphatase
MINEQQNDSLRPLCVDLDGTLIKADSLYQSFLLLLRKNCLRAFIALLHLTKGKWAYKRYLADQVQLDPSALPYNDELISWLKQEKAKGRELVLATASEQRIGERIANYTGLFSTCLGSYGKLNLKSSNKAAALNRRYGKGQYDYVGNHPADYAIWQDAHDAIVVNASAAVIRKAKQIANVTKIIAK